MDLGQAEQEKGRLWTVQRSPNQRGLDIWREGVLVVQYFIWPVDGCTVLQDEVKGDRLADEQTILLKRIPD